MDHHFEIYKLIITIGMRNNVTLDTSLATLWCDRRLNHGLCTSPIDDSLLLKLSSHFGSHVLSLDFWINCTEQAHASSLLGFVQCFMVHNFKWVQDEEYWKVFPSLNVSTNSIKEAAHALLSSVRFLLPMIAMFLFLSNLISNESFFSPSLSKGS